MLSCKEPGGLFAICELGNGALCAPFPDRARALPREKVPRRGGRSHRVAKRRVMRVDALYRPPSHKKSNQKRRSSMTHDVSGSTYKFEKAYPEYFRDLSDKEKEFAEFFVAMMNMTAQECTVSFAGGGAVTMLNGGREMKGSYSQDGNKLTVKGLPQFPEEGNLLDDAVDFLQRQEGDDTGVIHILFRKI